MTSLCQDFGLQQLHFNFFPQKNYNYVQSLKIVNLEYRCLPNLHYSQGSGQVQGLNWNLMMQWILPEKVKVSIFLVRLSMPVICTLRKLKL